MAKMLVGRSSQPGTRNTNAEKKRGRGRSFCDREDLSFSKGRRWFWLHVVVHGAVGTTKEESPEVKRAEGEKDVEEMEEEEEEKGRRTDGRTAKPKRRKKRRRQRIGGFSAAASKEAEKGGKENWRTIEDYIGRGRWGKYARGVLLCCTDMERQVKKRTCTLDAPKVASYFAKG